MWEYKKNMERINIQLSRLLLNLSNLYDMGVAWWSDKKQIVSHRVGVDKDMDDQLENMIYDIREYSFRRVYVYDTLHSDKEESSFQGCKNLHDCHLC